MCGIAGRVVSAGFDAAPRIDQRARVMKRIVHRGPDSEGEYTADQVWFGHARLSILDLTSAGNQPMSGRDGRQIICYNGEVYNFADVARDMRLEGLRSHSDTEVVLGAFEKEGVDSLSRLNGMFAFAIHDVAARKVWLVRDRLGIKPLYYRRRPGTLDFASEIPAILAFDQEGPECNVEAMHEWLYFGTALGEHTLCAGIQKLLPGHYLELELASMKVRTASYWQASALAGKPRYASAADDRIARTRELIEQAVTRQLVSDVPVGVFLSGGIDSSAVTAFAARHYSGRLSTYSVGFDFDKGVNELPKARSVAERYGTDHHEIHIAGADIASAVVSMVEHHGAPFSDAANIPLFLLAEHVKDHTKVVLQGDGGDELFGGYSRYTTLSWPSVARTVGSRIGRWLNAFTPRNGSRYRRRRYLNALAPRDFAIVMALLLTEEDAASPPTDVLHRDFASRVERVDPFVRYRRIQMEVAAEDPVNQMLFVDTMIILPEIFLEKVDRATMAASVEVRVPFLDNDLVEWALSLSGPQKVSAGRKKWLLKKALAGIVDDSILYGPKTGFGVPYGFWLKGALKPLFHDSLSTFQRRHPSILNGEVVEAIYAEHLSGRRDRSFLLWKLLNFLIWSDRLGVRFPT